MIQFIKEVTRKENIYNFVRAILIFSIMLAITITLKLITNGTL